MKTLTVDDDNRIRLPDARPRQMFGYQSQSGGRIVLTPITPGEQHPAKVRFEQRGGYTVGVSDQPITEAALNEALSEFP